MEWYIDRYRIKKDKESGIANDPNGWFEDPRDLVAAIERIGYVSVESTWTLGWGSSLGLFAPRDCTREIDGNGKTVHAQVLVRENNYRCIQ